VRTVFLGSSEFAVAVLRSLSTTDHRPELVVTPPDRPKGRGRRVGSPPLADAAREQGLPLLQTSDVNAGEALGQIEAVGPDAFGVCEFGQLIKEPLLSMRPMLNVHPSLLPRWRGAAPIERALMAGDQRTGMTIFQIVAELDAGPIALQREEAIRPADDYGTLSARLAALGGRLLIEAFDALSQDKLDLAPQDDGGATYASKIEARERRLDPSRPAQDLERQIRALTPHIGAHIELEGDRRLGIARAMTTGDAVTQGTLQVIDGRLVLGCSDGALELVEVRPAGKRAMAVGDYLRGTRGVPQPAS
jgi:methionyl-tRNA formyltransferase